LLGWGDLRIRQVEAVERVDDRRCDHEPGEPLLVARHHDPRRMRRRSVADRVLVRLVIRLPVFLLAHVAQRELPMLFSLVEALPETPRLLLARDVKEELQDQITVSREIPLERVDVLVALLPDVLSDKARRNALILQNIRMNAHDEDFFIVRTIED